jgi:hypothetical protein
MLHYKNQKTYDAALKKGTMCPSCRTSQNNKSSKRNVKKENNPAWKGLNDIPGKVFSKLKRGAIERKLCFEITIEDIFNQYVKQNKQCAFTGSYIVFGDDASIDRIDSSLGYTIDNIQIVHKKLNMMKKDMPNQEFILWCKAITNYCGSL